MARRSSGAAVIVALGLPLASVASVASCSSAAPPPVESVVGGDGGAGFDARSSPSDATGTQQEGAPADSAPTPLDSTTDSNAGDASSLPEAAAGPDAGPPVCNPLAAAGPPTLVLRTPDPDLLGAVSSDELVIAWTSLPVSGPVVHWAERATTGSPFGAPQTLAASFGPFAADHVGMTGDGLRLLFATADYTQIVEVARTARGTPFNTVQTATDFPSVNPTSGPDGTAGIGPFAAPTLSPDFSYWSYARGATGLVITHNVTGSWTDPNGPDGLDAFDDAGYASLSPTGWSADNRTLFFWDAVKATESMAWFDPFSRKVVGVATLGTTEQYAFPSGPCTSVYFSMQTPDAGSDTLDIYVAPLQ